MLPLEKLRRLREMSWPEMRFRTAQQLRIARERWKLARNGSAPAPPSWVEFWDVERIEDADLRQALRRAPEMPAGLLPGYFRTRPAPKFYFDAAQRDELVRVHARAFPGRAEQLRAAAETICAHRFQVFAYPEVECGREIAWRRDWVHGTESGLQHWSRVPFLDFQSVGDSKIVWEPNRHQHFVTLGQAYFLTGEERFAEECLAQWEHWQRDNPHLCGVNWASSLEVAFRTWSWLWAMHFLRDSRALSGARLARLVASLAQNAQFIAANISTYFSPNTHLLGEGFALFAAGLMLPELRDAELWRKTGQAILLEEIHKQVRRDGSHAEQSTYYHRYAIDFFLCAAVLAEQNGSALPASYPEQLERMAEFMLHTAWPSGRHPMMGDADGGRVLPLEPHDSNDHRATLSTAAVFFRRGDFRYRAGRFHEDTFWLLGPQAAEEFAGIPEAEPAASSRVFREAGMVTMRSGWDESARLLLFDAGPQGMHTCGHGHADALSFVCAADGTEWLIDPGTFVYTGSREGRDFFRSTRAHNTVVVDGLDQAEPADFFKWRRIPQVELERAATMPGLDWAVGRHNGYARRAGNVVHRRSVLFVKPDYWILTDEFSGSGEHLLEFCFHFAPGVELRQSSNGWVASQNGSSFSIVTPSGNLQWRVAMGESALLQGWYSENYGHRAPAPVLVGKARSPVPARFYTVLWPGAADVQARIAAGEGAHLEIEAEQWVDSVMPGAQSGSGLSTDAEMTFCRRDKSGAVVRAAIVRGSRVEVTGKELMRAEGKLEEFEMSCQGEMLEVHCRPADLPVRIHAPGIRDVRVNSRATRFVRAGDAVELRGVS